MRQRDIISRQALTNTGSSPLGSVAAAYSEETEDNRRSVNVIRHSRGGRRVAVTGIGIISPIGIGKSAFTQALRDGKSGVDNITSFDPSPLRCRIAGEVRDFDPSNYMDRKTITRTGRSTQFAMAAAMMGVEDSALDLSMEDPTRTGVMVGSSINEVGYAAKQYDRFVRDETKGQVSPYMAIIAFGGSCSSEVSILLKASGPSHCVATGCSSGNDAVGYAYRYIQNGEADIMIAGGSEAPIVPIVIASFSSMRALSKRNDSPSSASRPFDKERDGFVPAEGAAIVVLEERERARARGAHIYAEVLGYGSTNDAFHMSRPAPAGIEAIRAIRMALQSAKLESEDIDYVNAHGTSTTLNDRTEAKIIRAVFGRHAHSERFSVSSTKSMTGHAMGASCSIGLVASILARERGFLPPTINYEVPDPECDPDIDYIPNEAKLQQPQFILSNSFALGGKNACLVIGDP